MGELERVHGQLQSIEQTRWRTFRVDRGNILLPIRQSKVRPTRHRKKQCSSKLGLLILPLYARAASQYWSSTREGTYRHVTLTSNVCLCQTLFQLSRNSEINKLDFSLLVDQYIRRLDIWSLAILHQYIRNE